MRLVCAWRCVRREGSDQWTGSAMADGATPPRGTRKQRQSMAQARIAWGMRLELEKATPRLTTIGFECLGMPEQLRRIHVRLREEGLPEALLPKEKALGAFWKKRLGRT